MQYKFNYNLRTGINLTVHILNNTCFNLEHCVVMFVKTDAVVQLLERQSARVLIKRTLNSKCVLKRWF